MNKRGQINPYNNQNISQNNFNSYNQPIRPGFHPQNPNNPNYYQQPIKPEKKIKISWWAILGIIIIIILIFLSIRIYRNSKCGNETCESWEEIRKSCPEDCIIREPTEEKQTIPIDPEYNEDEEYQKEKDDKNDDEEVITNQSTQNQTNSTLNNTTNQTIKNYTLTSGYYNLSIVSDGINRTYHLYVPQSYNKENPTPLILNLHGGSGNGIQQCRDSKMLETSEKYGFIVTCPDGMPLIGNLLYWDDGDCMAPNSENDDIGFFLKMVEEIDKNYNIDNKRIYSTGISNGGIMSYKLACEQADKITAIAPVAASMVCFIPNCNPIRKVPVIIFHGLNDTHIPYYGGVGEDARSEYDHPSVQEAVDFWINKNQLQKTINITNKIGNASYIQYGSEDQSQVDLWTLEDGGHTWPGGTPTLSEEELGKTNTDISANEEMWEFFSKYTLS